jgi:tetratricopeptide (TPR) repeat protein
MKITNSSTLSIFLTLIILAAATSRGYAKARAGGGEADAHKKKGIELTDARHFDAAAEEFGKAIAADPKDPRLYHDRAIAYFSGGQAADANRDTAGADQRYTSAIADFSKEIELAPKEEAGYLGRGQAEVMLRQYDAALADLSKALELKPDDGLAFKFRGFAEIGLSQWDKAAADFTAAIQKDPNDLQSYDRRAWAYRNLKNYDGAIADYTVVLNKNPNDAETLAKRGYTYSLMQQYEKAIADYEQALKLNPNDIDTPQRLQYARGMLAAANATPPPPTPTPTPELVSTLLTPVNIVIATVALIVIAIVVRLVTRGKVEPTSHRIR